MLFSISSDCACAYVGLLFSFLLSSRQIRKWNSICFVLFVFFQCQWAAIYHHLKWAKPHQVLRTYKMHSNGKMWNSLWETTKVGKTRQRFGAAKYSTNIFVHRSWFCPIGCALAGTIFTTFLYIRHKWLTNWKRRIYRQQNTRTLPYNRPTVIVGVCRYFIQPIKCLAKCVWRFCKFMCNLLRI